MLSSSRIGSAAIAVLSGEPACQCRVGSRKLFAMIVGYIKYTEPTVALDR